MIGLDGRAERLEAEAEAGLRPRPARDPGDRSLRGHDRRLLEGDLMDLRVCALYPDLMNIYADRGNILVLRRRCEWRGIGFELPRRARAKRFDPAAHDLIYIGGGQDRDQRGRRRRHGQTKRDGARRGGRRRRGRARRLRRLPAARQQLPARRGAARRASGWPTCETVREPGPRLIGNVAIEADLGGGPQVSPASRTTAAAPTSARARGRSAG